ncbi:hypothetical protein A4A49_24897 [Nicotiana attenuata]|uniref:Transmembrane protein n=1 Tax=Nicotiana attenuata TaxID=49451 RepID=A0A1J6JBE7_NICAT|nr:hypothetical protein A4A49_24897 [Nicotiana attenuata]
MSSMACLRVSNIFLLMILTVICLKMTVAQDVGSEDNIAPSPALVAGDGFAPATSVGFFFTCYVINVLIMH